MKKSIKKIVLVLIALLGAYFIYSYFFKSSGNFESIYLVPKDAIYILETDEPIDNWNKIRKSETWQHLQKNAYFAELTEDANALNEMLDENPRIFKLLGSRNLVISAHLYKKYDYDFLYILDLKKVENANFLQNNLSKFIGDGYKISQRKFKTHEIIELRDLEDNSILYISFHQNKALLSYKHNLLEASIAQIETPEIGRNFKFINVNQEINGDGMFRLYWQYAFLDDYLRCYSNETNDYVKATSEALAFSGLAFNMDENLLELKGFSNLVDTASSVLHAMLNSGTGKIEIPEIAPQRTAFYLGLGFDDFSEFYEAFENNLKQSDSASHQSLKENTEKVEKFLKINLKENFIDWVDDEIAFVQMQASKLGKDNEFVVIFKSKDIEEAKENLDFINKQIRKKTPSRFKSVSYKNHEIRFLSIDGFFKLLLGKLLSKLEKPYYTIIEDYVIFSNHPQTIKSIIDDFEAGKTLAQNPEFQVFKENFNPSNNLLIYVQTPILQENLKTFVDAETWQDIQKNKSYINCFNQIGFQLTEDGNLFETNFLVQYQDINSVKTNYIFPQPYNQKEEEILYFLLKNPVQKDELVHVDEISPDDLDDNKYQEFFEGKKLKVEVGLKNGLKNGTYREYFETGEIKIKGKYRKDKKHGTWKIYDKEGNTIEKRRFRNGKELF